MMGIGELYIVMVMSGLFWGTGIVGTMGLPPAGRDANLARTATADSLIYLEWSERGPGKEGAKGIDGLAADPEVRQFVKDVYKAIETGIAKETERGGPEEKAMGKHIPPVVKILLNRPGCLSVRFDEKALKAGGGDAGAEPIPGMRWLSLVAALKATLVVNGGKDADTIAGHLEELVKLLPPELQKKGLQRQPLPLPPDAPGMSLTVHRHKDYFILGFGKGAIDSAIAGLDGKSKGLTAHKTFAEAVKRVSFERTANLMWIDAKAVIGKVTGLMGKEIGGMLKLLGVDEMDVLVTATGVIDGEIRTRSYIGTGGKTDGILALFSGRGIKKADLAHVPADSDLVVAFSVNGKGILSAVRKIIAVADPGSKDDFEKLIKQFETELGLKLEDDLLKAFGDVWVLHDSKSAGGVFVTSLVASLEVRNAGKASDVFTKLMDVLEEALPGEIRGGFRPRRVELKNKRFMDHTIYYINTVGDDIPFAPAFCLTKTHLLAAPHPQALKAHLRFLKSKDANFAGRLGKDLALPKGDLLGVTFMESKRLLRALYGIAPYVGQMIMSEVQREGAEIDIFSLPSARAVLPYLGNSFSTTVRTEKGIFVEAQSAVPGAGGGAVIGMMMPWFVLYGASARGVRPPAIEKKLMRLDRKPSKSALKDLFPRLFKRSKRARTVRPVSAVRPGQRKTLTAA